MHPDSGSFIANLFTFQALLKSKPDLKLVINEKQALKIKTKEAAHCFFEYVYTGHIYFSKPENGFDSVQCAIDLSEFAVSYDIPAICVLTASFLIRSLSPKSIALIASFLKDN